MKLWWHLLHGWLGHAAGAVVCWWRREHVEVHETGTLPGTTWGGMHFDLNIDPDSSSNYWDRTYCIRCGATLREETP